MSYRDRFNDWVRRHIIDDAENLWPEHQPLDDDVPEPEPEEETVTEPSCKWCGGPMTIPVEYNHNPHAALHCAKCDRKEPVSCK